MILVNVDHGSQTKDIGYEWLELGCVLSFSLVIQNIYCHIKVLRRVSVKKTTY